MQGSARTETQLPADAQLLASPATGEARATSLWSLPAHQARFLTWALATAAVVLFFRLVNLDRLQDEMYGDITIVYDYVRNVMEGKWPAQFDVSAGPLYHYLITPVIAFTGLTYYGLKLASVIVSLGVLAATYALSRRLLGDWFALMATAIAGISSWLLIFSRLGNSQILVPLLATIPLWLIVRYMESGRRADLIASAVVSSLGLYVYPQAFILPAVTFLVLLCLILTRPVRTGPLAHRRAMAGVSDLLVFVLVTLVCALPFAAIAVKNLQGFLTGYIGIKLQSAEGPLTVLMDNLSKALLAFFTDGDVSTRSNIGGAPHIDPISGLFMLGGIAFWLMPRRIRWSPLLLVPFVLLQIPSILVLARPEEVPSASRTLGVAPIVYILVASGLWGLATSIMRRLPEFARVICWLSLALIVMLNASRYFGAYINGLPYQNTPIGALIAGYADSLPPGTHVYLEGCCWRGNMPEPKGIEYRMVRPQQLNYMSSPATLTCDALQLMPQPAVIIWSDQDELPNPALKPCEAWLSVETYGSSAGLPAFHAAHVRTGAQPVTLQSAPQPAVSDRPEAPAAQIGPDNLEYSTAEYRGQLVRVLHSPLDMGQVANLFDNNPASLLRGASDNPLVLELRFPEPIDAGALSVIVGTMSEFQITGTLTYVDGSTGVVHERYKDPPPDPTLTLELPSNKPALHACRVEIEYLGEPPGEGYHIHVRDLQLK